MEPLIQRRSREKRGREEKEEQKSILQPPYASYPPLCCSPVPLVFVLFFPHLLILKCVPVLSFIVYFIFLSHISPIMSSLSGFTFSLISSPPPIFALSHLPLVLSLPYRSISQSLPSFSQVSQVLYCCCSKI